MVSYLLVTSGWNCADVVAVQRITTPMLVVAFVVDLLHPVWCWLYIHHFDMGIDGMWSHMSTYGWLFICALTPRECTVACNRSISLYTAHTHAWRLHIRG